MFVLSAGRLEKRINDKIYLQYPVKTSLFVQDADPVVLGVGDDPSGQYVPVRQSYPGDMKTKSFITTVNSVYYL